MNSIFLDLAARHILSCHPQGAYDLRGSTILLPNHHVAKPLAQALIRTSGQPALLLPQMITLNAWAQSVCTGQHVQSDIQRTITLYRALRERHWFSDIDLWGLSRELLELIDELTLYHVALPESANEFAVQLADAYRARSGQAMQFEARVVHELWYAMASGTQPDSTRAYQQQLAQLAQQVDMPLYMLQTCDQPAPEARFLEACHTRIPVTIFDLRKMAADMPDCALLVHALQHKADSSNLRSTASLLEAHPEAALNCPAKGFGRKLGLFGAHGLEQEAQAADVQIRSWLLEGMQSVAVVVQDRLVARRVRALLERAQIQVQDETGWTFSTLSVSTVLMRWLEAVQNDFYYQDVLDLFKSPFLFADTSANERKYAACLFEQMVRKHGVIAHLEDFLDIAQRESPGLIQPLVRLRQAAQALPKKNMSLADWLLALHDSLDILGILQGWSQDAAGQQLLQLFEQWANELGEDDMRCSFAEWRRWLSQQLDLNTFRDTAIESPVLFTHLAATRWRSFDAVLLLGGDAAHLPAPSNTGKCFNDAVRTTLGLPPGSAQQAQVCDDLLALLAMNRNVLATWQASKNGEPNLRSPYLEMLRALHLLAYGDDLSAKGLGELITHAAIDTTTTPLPAAIQEAGANGAPSVPSDLIPRHISPSGYNSLVACPYQFHARHILQLNPLDEVREELDKRDYGTWVHAILQRFHDRFPLLSDHARAQIEDELQQISKAVFAEALAHDYLAQAWLLRWQAQIPSYLNWQLENERMGWRYAEAEAPFTIQVTENLCLRGRIDRVDSHAGNPQQQRVLDYKTQSVSALRSRLKEAGEDVQLACYAFARTACDAAFVALEAGKVSAVQPPHGTGELSELNIRRLQEIFGQLHQGATLPANGTEMACRYCEMSGLCRRDYWQEASHG